MTAQKETLVRYLQQSREALLWKLDGVNDRDIRRSVSQTFQKMLGRGGQAAWRR